jgi:precorrin-6A synthase
MRTVSIIGIGAGSPEHVTVQAIEALNATDVFFVADKGAEKADLATLREEICARFIRAPRYRLARFADPERGASGAYRADVDAWHRAREVIYERLLFGELADGERGAFLAWGDPALYDSTLRIVESIRARRAGELACEVIPGISSVQVLAARHRVPLNRIGEPVLVTTGRQLRDGYPAGADSVVVMLDGECTFRRCAGLELDIWWGAYLGTPHEILIAGRLDDVMDEIERTRAEARARKGWVMDTYLLKKPDPESGT